MTPLRRTGGFSLIELVISVALVGVLALMAVPLLDMTRQRQQEAELRLALRQIRNAIDEYRQAVKDKRIEAAADASGYPPNLALLAAGVRDAKSPEGKPIYFLRRLPRDPFNPDADLKPEETWKTRAYASPPDDPREGEDVFDVYSASERSGLNGIPYKEW